MHDHKRFVWEFVGKVGVPVFAGTLVGCLLSHRLEPMHIVLMAAGLGMMFLDHWVEHHRSP